MFDGKLKNNKDELMSLEEAAHAEQTQESDLHKFDTIDEAIPNRQNSIRQRNVSRIPPANARARF